MTSQYNFRFREERDWKKLCYGEPLLKARKEPVTPKRVLLEDSYVVQRLISRKTDAKEGILYLVQWQDFSIIDSTWEPKVNIDEESLSCFFPSQIETCRLKSAVSIFEDAIQERLKPGNRQNATVIRFEHDIYRYCFQSEKEVVLESADALNRLPLERNWYYKINQRGIGLKIKFPIRLTPKIKMVKTCIQEQGTVLLKLKPVETIRISTATCNFC